MNHPRSISVEAPPIAGDRRQSISGSKRSSPFSLDVNMTVSGETLAGRGPLTNWLTAIFEADQF